MNTKLRMLGYIRVSTKKQDKGYSLEAQKNSIQMYCQLYQHELIEIKQDRASGSKKNQGLTQILKKLYEENYDGIIVDKLDRLFRNTVELLQTVKELREKGKFLISVSEQFDISTPVGQLIVTIMSGIAEFERSRIKERIMTGKRNKKSEGAYVAGQPPLGYKSKEVRTKYGKVMKILEKDEKEQEILKFIRNHRKTGKSFDKISKLLNLKGYKTKRNKKFTATQVYRVFKFKSKLLKSVKLKAGLL